LGFECFFPEVDTGTVTTGGQNADFADFMKVESFEELTHLSGMSSCCQEDGEVVVVF